MTIFQDSGYNAVNVSASTPLPVAATFAPPVPSGSTKATFVRGVLIPASAAVPEPLAAAGTYVNSVTIIAQRAARVANTSSVWIDAIATNNAQLIELTPGAAASPGINGSFYSFVAPPGKVIDLGDIYVDVVTQGDGVSFLGLL